MVGIEVNVRPGRKVWSRAIPSTGRSRPLSGCSTASPVGTMCVVSAPRLHAALVRTLAELRRTDGGLPVSVQGVSEVEPTAVAALALDDAPARAWLAARLRADGGFEEKDGRDDGPTSSALGALALADRRDARRALAYAISHRGLPLPNAPDPDRRTAWGWTADARSLTEPTARVLLAVNALTPDDAATRREAVGLLRARQCADGGWNFGNASVYDVDLRGYAQTTAMGLIALQQGHAPDRLARVRVPRCELAPRARRAHGRAGARRVPPPSARRRACPSSSPRWSRSRAGPRSARGPSPSPGRRLRPARTPGSSL